MKRWLSFMLAFVLNMIPGLSSVGSQAGAAAESTGAGSVTPTGQVLPCYVPETLTKLFNEAILPQGSGTGADVEKYASGSGSPKFLLHYDGTDEKTVYYMNPDGNLQMQFAFGSGVSPDPASPAQTVTLAVAEDFGPDLAEGAVNAFLAALGKTAPEWDPEKADSWIRSLEASPSSLAVPMGMLIYQPAADFRLYHLTASEPSATPSPAPKERLKVDLSQLSELVSGAEEEPISGSGGQSAGSQAPYVLRIDEKDTEYFDPAGLGVCLLSLERVGETGRQIDLTFRWINRTGQKICVEAEEASVNGLGVNAYGSIILKDGEEGKTDFFIQPSSSGSEDTAAFWDPSSIRMTYKFKNFKTNEWLGRTTVLIEVNEKNPVLTPQPTATPTAKPTEKPTAKPTAKPSKGEQGSALQRLKAFAKPLEIPDSSNGQWRNANGNKSLQFRCQVKNISSDKSIRGFELYAYCTDVWGNRIYGDDTVYYHTTTKQIKPGKTVYSDYLTLPDRSEIYEVHVGINKVVMENGDIKQYSDIDYITWEIR